MIAGTYILSGGLLVVTSILFKSHSLDATGVTVALTIVFFFASAGASAAYLTVSEVFPMETRALCISVFYAVGTGIGGIIGPLVFSRLIKSGDFGQAQIALLLGAVMMLDRRSDRDHLRRQGRGPDAREHRQAAHRRGHAGKQRPRFGVGAGNGVAPSAASGFGHRGLVLRGRVRAAVRHGIGVRQGGETGRVTLGARDQLVGRLLDRSSAGSRTSSRSRPPADGGRRSRASTARARRRSRRTAQADRGRVEQPEHLLVLGLLGARGVAPASSAGPGSGAIPSSRRTRRVEPLRHPLGGLDAEAVHEQLLGELAVGLELRHQLGHLVAGGHRLQRDHVELAGAQRPVEVGEADAVVACGWRGNTSRSSSALAGGVRVPDDQLVAVGVAREVAEQRARMQVGLLTPHPLQPRLEVVAQQLAPTPRP